MQTQYLAGMSVALIYICADRIMFKHRLCLHNHEPAGENQSLWIAAAFVHNGLEWTKSSHQMAYILLVPIQHTIFQV